MIFPALKVTLDETSTLALIVIADLKVAEVTLPVSASELKFGVTTASNLIVIEPSPVFVTPFIVGEEPPL
jgi:hypothetical protein